MPPAVPLSLDAWADFYLVVGGAAAGLTGLMFVVVSLLADRQRGGDTQAHHAFGTPTVFHFTVVLLISGVLTMPRHTTWTAGGAVVLLGVGGVGFLARAARRIGRQDDYDPETADWWWYAIVPIATYALIAGTAALILWRPEWGLDGVAVATMLLLVVGIHNSWDTATYIAVEDPGADPAANADAKATAQT